MLDRQKIETVLSRRFPGATTEQIAAAANAIMGSDVVSEEQRGNRQYWAVTAAGNASAAQPDVGKVD
jgi:hypothetical protein